jgi:hypothetical protein
LRAGGSGGGRFGEGAVRVVGLNQQLELLADHGLLKDISPKVKGQAADQAGEASGMKELRVG